MIKVWDVWATVVVPAISVVALFVNDWYAPWVVCVYIREEGPYAYPATYASRTGVFANVYAA
jgi:hypothetical protein